jgi:hypothetical protein
MRILGAGHASPARCRHRTQSRVITGSTRAQHLADVCGRPSRMVEPKMALLEAPSACPSRDQPVISVPTLVGQPRWLREGRPWASSAVNWSSVSEESPGDLIRRRSGDSLESRARHECHRPMPNREPGHEPRGRCLFSKHTTNNFDAMITTAHRCYETPGIACIPQPALIDDQARAASARFVGGSTPYRVRHAAGTVGGSSTLP